jgi:Gram-negative porin
VKKAFLLPVPWLRDQMAETGLVPADESDCVRLKCVASQLRQGENIMDWLKANWIGMLVGALIAVAVLFATGHAHAADLTAKLGGDCCSDLEERIAELEATSARKGNRKVSLKVYGQVSETLTYWSEPGFNHYQVQSNGNRAGETFVGFAGEAQILPKTFGGFVLEISAGQFQPGTSFPFASAFSGGNDTNGVGTRQAYVYLKGEAGTFSIGTQQDATWNITGLTGQITDDLASTDIAHTKLSVRGFTGAGFSEVLDLWDGVRNDSVKYVSPTFYGLSLSASWGDALNPNASGGLFSSSGTQGSIWDVALRFDKEFGEFRTQAAVGYRDGTAINGLPAINGLAVQGLHVFSGSAGVQHLPTGLFANGSYGNLDATTLFPGSGAKGITAWEVQVGDEMHLTRIGHTTVYGDYGQMDLTHLFGVTDNFGLGVVQAIDPAAMSLFVSWQRWQNETVLIQGDADTFMAGARIKF